MGAKQKNMHPQKISYGNRSCFFPFRNIFTPPSVKSLVFSANTAAPALPEKRSDEIPYFRLLFFARFF